MKARSSFAAACLTCVFVLSGCSSSDDPTNGGTAGSNGSGGTSSSTDGPTWYGDIAPLVTEHCLSCHTEGGIAPFSLENYELAKMWSGSFDGVLPTRQMPPFLAAETDDCKPRFGFKDDLRLSDAEIDLFKRWNEAGNPEGDPKAAAPLPAPAELELSDAEVSTAIPAPVTITGPGDQFICFSLTPDLSALAATGAAATLLGDHVLVDAAQIHPGNAAIVHHVLVFTDEAGQSAALAGDKGYYDCFGGPKLDQPSLVMAWAPGATPLIAPEGVAMVVPTKGRLVMQVHYHPASTPQTDEGTSLQLRGYGTGIPSYVSTLNLIGNAGRRAEGLQAGPDDEGAPEFRIPAGATNHTETMLFTMPDSTPEFRLWAVGSHMHYVGTDMRIGITRAAPDSEPADECLLETPNWDFDWQRGYRYDTPIERAPTVRAGDVLNLRCTYDNSMQNSNVANALVEQGLSEPRDVLLGEETLDEMCLGIFGFAQKVSDLLK